MLCEDDAEPMDSTTRQPFRIPSLQLPQNSDRKTGRPALRVTERVRRVVMERLIISRAVVTPFVCALFDGQRNLPLSRRLPLVGRTHRGAFVICRIRNHAGGIWVLS